MQFNAVALMAALLALKPPLAYAAAGDCALGGKHLGDDCKKAADKGQNPSPPPPPPSGAAHLTNRRLLSIHGPDAPKFLQGIITANVRPDTRAGFYAAFLTGQGKVLNDVFVYPTLGSTWHNEAHGDEDPGFLVEVDAAQAGELERHVKRHKLRAKIKLRLLEEGEMRVWGVWREDERWTAHSQGGSVVDGELGLVDCRAPGMGRRVLVPAGSAGGSPVGKPGSLEELEGAPLSAYTIRRYLRGVPEGQQELRREDVLPLNANIDLMGGIDFKKGCYTGQELTIRTHHTGVVRRRILPVSLYDVTGDVPETLEYSATAQLTIPDSETDIKKQDKRNRATGKFVAGIGNIGLAMCRLEQMTDLIVSSEGSTVSEGDKFAALNADGADVGVMAFVPDWLRGQIRAPKIQKRV
ncbi:hypothetical protein B0A48_04641 [Cryoendolithus antarcticus]|uniref:Iron-sulfur cluster assembly factor IBA57 homolog, mitochondrial n=1 Tax=Cryoendolithus antarcticus TaxID=1507870 RepID=A0A1V8TFY0_9PEZI|nr:hypothetical protein B0A48_04641 [Cryoendolithus antarcticus]